MTKHIKPDKVKKVQTVEKVQKVEKVQRTPRDSRKKDGPSCPVYWKCGGCQLEDASYEEQVKEKENLIRKQLGGFCKVQPMIEMEVPYHYRNSVHALFDRDNRNQPISGVYRKGTKYVLAIEDCMLDDEKAQAIIGSIRGLLKSFKIRTYDEKTGYGLLRKVIVRRGNSSNEVLVALVTASPVFPSKNNFVTALRKLHPEITTIIQNVNGREHGKAIGDKEKVLFGKGYIEDGLCGEMFTITFKSAYPMNCTQAEMVYQKAMKEAGLSKKECVLDINCGSGILSVLIGNQAKQVIGVESNREVAREAISNVKKAKMDNIRILNTSIMQFLNEFIQVGTKADVLFINQSRAGNTEDVLQLMGQVKPKKMVYLSESAVGLKEDLEYWTTHGYRVTQVCPVDVQPFKSKVDTICVLERKGY